MGAGEARVRLVRTPDGQSLDIPRAFALRGDQTVLRMEGGRLVVESIPQPPLLAVPAELDDLSEDWPAIDDPPPEAVRP